jgi:hypothetical protein
MITQQRRLKCSLLIPTRLPPGRDVLEQPGGGLNPSSGFVDLATALHTLRDNVDKDDVLRLGLGTLLDSLVEIPMASNHGRRFRFLMEWRPLVTLVALITSLGNPESMAGCKNNGTANLGLRPGDLLLNSGSLILRALAVSSG